MKDNTEKWTKGVINQMFIQKSRNLINRVFNIFTFLPFVAKPADQREKYLQNRYS